MTSATRSEENMACTSLSAPVGDADASGPGIGMDVAMGMSEAQLMAGPMR